MNEPSFEERHIDLTVVGPELPLTLGLIDALRQQGLHGFGPGTAAGREPAVLGPYRPKGPLGDAAELHPVIPLLVTRDARSTMIRSA